MYAVRWLLLVIVAGLLLNSPSTLAQTVEPRTAQQLAGLWEARQRYGPDVRGSLLIRQLNGGWWAEIAGRSAQAKMTGEAITFELPDGKGSFQGKFDARRTRIAGHWIQPVTVANGTPYASPVTLI
jgi:hypothetical protein